MPEEIISPPYPDESATADSLFAALRELRRWIEHYRGGVNEVLGGEAIVAPREIPSRVAYVSQPVCQQFGHLRWLRRIREEWDHLVRTYEDSWDCKACVLQRIVLVRTAAAILADAFVPQEVRELRAEKRAKEMENTFSELFKQLSDFARPASHDPQTFKPEDPDAFAGGDVDPDNN